LSKKIRYFLFSFQLDIFSSKGFDILFNIFGGRKTTSVGVRGVHGLSKSGDPFKSIQLVKRKNPHKKLSFGKNRTQLKKLTNPLVLQFFKIFFIKIIKILSFDS
jgi:hypothetical protein